jgi:hypothetical protein
MPEPEPHRHEVEDEATKAVDDVIEFFEAEGDDDSPTADSESPPPG